MNAGTLVRLDRIRLDGGTQCRCDLDLPHINDLAEARSNGAQLPPLVVFHDGTNYWLADGFHRYHALHKTGHQEVECDVRSGPRLEAIKFALGANCQHGLRRTIADKRRAVEIALKEFPKLSSREIARICAVGDQMVNQLRDSRSSKKPGGAQLATDASSLPQPPENGSRVGADGKTRRLPAKPKPALAEEQPEKLSESETAELGRMEGIIAKGLGRKPAASTINSNALQYATMAIIDLEKIDRADPKRQAAFDEVITWITKHR